ncbi:hypothetical protein YC2023_026062 [Brassica napus]
MLVSFKPPTDSLVDRHVSYAFSYVTRGKRFIKHLLIWIMLLREISHENHVNVHINSADMSLYLAFDYLEHDLYEIIRHHRD